MAISRRAFLLGSGAAAVLGTCGYSVGIEPIWPRLHRVTMRLPNLPSSWIGRTVCQLSDLHVCPRVSSDYLRRAFRQVAAVKPDLVVYTGDFVTLEGDACARLEALKPDLPLGKVGTFGVLGNHDYHPGGGRRDVAVEVLTSVESAGIRILRNSSATVSGLQIVGTDDLWAARFEPKVAFAKTDRDAPTIALAHNPDCVDWPGWDGFRGWVLAGHTHGGQIQPPFLPSPFLPVRNRRYTAGEFDVGGGRTLYINRGLGYLVRVRFNMRPEITVFTLAAA